MTRADVGVTVWVRQAGTLGYAESTLPAAIADIVTVWIQMPTATPPVPLVTEERLGRNLGHVGREGGSRMKFVLIDDGVSDDLAVSNLFVQCVSEI